MAIINLGNFKNSRGNIYKGHWNNNTFKVWLSKSIEGPWHLQSARNKSEAKKIAQEAVENLP